MNRESKYAVISPVRNEEKHIQLTIDSMLAQTVRPLWWIIVNDGSTDRTGKICDAAALSHSWIRVVNRVDRGFRQAGGGVVDAFYEGFRHVEFDTWDFVVKLDGDLSFPRDYFEQCLRHFDRDERLGIAGGTICIKKEGGLEPESRTDPRFHVRGATKVYRRTCWDAIGGLVRSPGWDTMDEVKANMLGWTTCTFSDVAAIHHRPTGAAYGAWKDRVKNGMGCYITGYHPLFMLLKCVRRLPHRPYVVGACGQLFGFAKGYVKRVPRAGDNTVIRYLRQQQINRLLGRKSLWT